MINDSMFTSNDQTWETPEDFFQKLNSCFHFTTDVCATFLSKKCDHYYDEEINGLAQEWEGVCWMNPPYGREQISWIRKAEEQSRKEGTMVVCLIPARPDTKIWQYTIFPEARSVTFIRGRLKFGEGTCAAPFPSALIVFGRMSSDEQREVLHSLGQTYEQI